MSEPCEIVLSLTNVSKVVDFHSELSRLSA